MLTPEQIDQLAAELQQSEATRTRSSISPSAFPA
jgi:hypothetical protein